MNMTENKPYKSTTTTECGRYGEDVAAKYLQSKGYKILARNFRYSHRELDIIAENDQWVIFVEVKTRTNRGDNLIKYGPPGRAVNLKKQRFIVSAANHYIRLNHPNKWPRLDVIEVFLSPTKKFGKPIVEKINHMEGAFHVR